MQCQRFLVHISHGLDNPDKVTTGAMLAAAAATKGLETVLLLSNEAARLAVKGAFADIHEKGHPPVDELISGFIELGGKIFV